MEQMLANKSIDIPFCISWANEAWTKAWVGDTKKVLIPQLYGEEKEWRAHFDYLLPFLKDKRYILENDCPLMLIYRPHIIPCFNEMITCWKKWAIEEGINGLTIVAQNIEAQNQKLPMDSCIDRYVEFQPVVARDDMSRENNRFQTLKKTRRKVGYFIDKKFGIDILRLGLGTINKLNNMSRISYDDTWKAILKRTPCSEKNYPGAFVRWDNSPRHGERARIFIGETPEKFEKHMTEQIRRTRDLYHKDKLFVYAWNEWAEGGYLEPDQEHGYVYLEAIQHALIANGEFPER